MKTQQSLTNITKKSDLKNFDLSDLTTFINEIGEPSFRAKQIYSWLYKPEVRSFEQMTNVSKEFRRKLKDLATISQLSLKLREESQDGTIKYAFSLFDENIIESVLIPDQGRNTLCVSSQVGCAMGCKFCQTGTMGIIRNLSPAEIVNQVYYAQEELTKNNGESINNIVFMGMGEPLANFENLIKSISILLEQLGLNFSSRRITVSTCGIVPKIAELGKRTSVNLAISLHAVTDQTRDLLMPINKTYSLNSLLDACRQFPLPKRKRIMIEYVLIDSINDSVKDAHLLVKKLHGIPCKINLLPFNECPTLPYKKPNHEKIGVFQEILNEAGHTVIVRTSRGDDISAACGQLAGKLLNK